MGAIEKLTSSALSAVAHGFLGRSGGVSAGIYAGLNVGLGSADNRAAIDENRVRAANAVLSGAALNTVHQIHSNKVITVDRPFGDDRPEADAMVTATPGILLGILTADCVPILFADEQARVIGAAHSGWKGSITGIMDETVKAMVKLGASRENIACAIGPCIAQKSYEVDEGFFERFIEADPANDHFFIGGKAGHYQFDIEGYVAARLAAAGIRKIECMGEDTYSQPDRFFSYRRTCHKAESDYGRQISLIGLTQQ
ncbi:peptidoglycan editing factor PgeF [Sphingorhabdus arenilitoris]|uniref:Purine nucleoside phosphorylase n=1 Tax=Sphingorhabdus arenilitoris TaxID=1490041 RepID=A0ABV8REZ1_9SPHN